MLEGLLAMRLPPAGALTIDRAASGDRDVPEAAPADERRVGQLVTALPAGAHQGVVGRVLAPDEHRAGVEVERHVGAQLEGARDVAARRKAHRPTALLRRGVDPFLERAGGRCAHSLIAPMVTPFTK